MKRDDFIFAVGFQGNTAIVDKKAQRQYRKLTIDQLLERGFTGPALRAAIFDGDEAVVDLVREVYNRTGGTDYETGQLKRLFGVDSVPEGVARVRAL